jgi:zinc and cadmium transporter
MSTLTAIILATFFVSALSFLGVLVLYRNNSQKWLRVIISIAAGALLGAVFFDIFPELFSTENPTSKLSTQTISIIILISILFFFIVEKYFHWHHCHCDEPGHCHDKKPLGYINLIGDGLHNFTDGTLIAASFMIDFQLGIVTTIAITLHEIPHEISDFGILLYSGFTKSKALLWNFISAITAMVGGLFAYYFGNSVESVVPIFLALAAGSLLYLAMSDIMPELHHETERKYIAWQTSWLLIGVIIIYIITFSLTELH